MRSSIVFLAAIASLPFAALHAQAPTAQPTPPDKYAWLEDVSGTRSMDWVNAENARTAKLLNTDPRYGQFYDAALKLAEDPKRLAVPGLRGDEVYNNWRDAQNPRGLLRKTTLADYLTPTPHWTPSSTTTRWAGPSTWAGSARAFPASFPAISTASSRSPQAARMP